MTNKTIPLPKPVLETDVWSAEDWLKPENRDGYYEESYTAPHYTEYGGAVSFELWYTERFGWLIPTLTIRENRGRAARHATRRSYAIAIKDGSLVSAGMGPHVLRTVTIRVKKARLEALRPLLDLMVEGAGKAGECRDRRSTRMAQGRLRRSNLNNLLGGF